MDRDEALRLLRGGREGIVEWNRRRAADEEIPDLIKADLTGADLTGAHLGGADLRGAHLFRADLTWAHLGGADLRGAHLFRAHLHGAHLGGAHLTGADLTGAHLRGAIIDDTTTLDAPWRRVWEIVNEPTAGRDLRGADLHGADLGGAHLRGADLDGADLRGAHLLRADLGEADLRGADLRGADLDEADLTGAHLGGADLREADLRGGADLRGADLHEADLRGAHLGGAHLRGADLRGTIIDDPTALDAPWRRVWEIVNEPTAGRDLRGADLHRADLGGANLRGADLGGAHLDGADLHEADLGGADLGGADLTGADLTGADLTGAHLRGAIIDDPTALDAPWRRVWEIVNEPTAGRDLRGADLHGADLHEVDLHGADLRGANLRGVDLHGADLRGARLIEADLSEANLIRADLGGADLGGAHLDRARCWRTIFADADLSGVEGLESIQHDGPSTIGIDTFFRSKGKIPEAFLRGCGVPDPLIASLPSLIGSMVPIQFCSCFISYSTKDEDFVKRLHSRMRDEGLRVWYSPEDIKGGQKLHEQIDQAIRGYEKLLLVLSPNSMNSEWVKTEIRKARKIEIKEGQRKLFPIRLVDFETIREWECFDADSGKDLGVEIREYFIPDFSNWKEHDDFEAGFARLLEDLKKADGSTVK